MPRKIVAGRDNEPYAQKTELGWGVIGNVSRFRRDIEENEREPAHVTHRTVTRSASDLNVFDSKTCYFTLRTTAKELINPVQVRQMMESDFSERKSAEQPMSLDDKKFMEKMKQGIRQGNDGHYEMPLPFPDEKPRMSNNRSLAMHRLAKLKTRLENDEQYRNDYVAFMNDLIEKKYAERVPEQQLPTNNSRIWYIPHHRVYHPKKPTKMRVVFDCSAQYKGESLDSYQLQGPDLTNQLLGVLCRFRQNPLAFMCDVESMFHQFKVLTAHRDFLRFLWWENGNTTNLRLNLE